MREYLEVVQSHYSRASGDSGTVYIGGEGLDFSANMDKVKNVIQVSSSCMAYWNFLNYIRRFHRLSKVKQELRVL